MDDLNIINKKIISDMKCLENLTIKSITNVRDLFIYLFIYFSVVKDVIPPRKGKNRTRQKYQ